MPEKFKLTYATMFNPPEELHTKFEDALEKVKGRLGLEWGIFVNGKEYFTEQKFEDCCPANHDLVLGIFQKGDAKTADLAVTAARKAYPMWSRMKWIDRVALLRRAAEIIDERTFEIAAVLAMEVGKNRMEALGDVAETADLIRYSCSQMEINQGYFKEMGRDPLVGYKSTNFSVLRPYGVWLVISPFNFPAALTGGPSGSALVAGNTLVIKPATDTPWTVRLLAECLRDSGIPDGVINFITGPGSTLGKALIEHPEIDGVTFTGSYDTGMQMFRDFAKGKYPRPIILEMGGKNPAIVSHHADLERAAVGIVRSAFGLQGQKCSACSRVFVEEHVYDALIDRLVALTEKLIIGDPTARNVYMGPVINQNAYSDFIHFTQELSSKAKILTGGNILTEGEFSRGYFCAPTLVAELPLDHYLWQYEMFLPITTIAKVESLQKALELANDVNFGLTAGFYGNQEEVKCFFENIQAGVTYANRPQGATTGAWPGFQPFGGWKGSGATGKNSGGSYYLPLYMHEQIQTIVE